MRFNKRLSLGDAQDARRGAVARLTKAVRRALHERPRGSSIRRSSCLRRDIGGDIEAVFAKVGRSLAVSTSSCTLRVRTRDEWRRLVDESRSFRTTMVYLAYSLSRWRAGPGPLMSLAVRRSILTLCTGSQRVFPTTTSWASQGRTRARCAIRRSVGREHPRQCRLGGSDQTSPRQASRVLEICNLSHRRALCAATSRRRRLPKRSVLLSEAGKGITGEVLSSMPASTPGQ